ncbi:magnesium transporter MRS2-F-like isoform X2 [Pistacia vera]|uniref:magnesium transporter MRS2-F-like isoform X2 n=1 Tax=Pistacia vera TaxID=55513 RepID=UPI0012634419|nr:magnesium transporter MRS2-F-like isoform X2 [Pistacia vera]
MASSNSTPPTAGDDDDREPFSVPPRQKVLGTKSWLVVSELGESRNEKVGKYWIMRRTGLPARDLRVLDPMLSYPSTIMGRERAIVVNLEHIKAIITAKEVFLLNSINHLVVEFVQDLQHRISSLHGTPTRQKLGRASSMIRPSRRLNEVVINLLVLKQRDELGSDDKAEWPTQGQRQRTSQSPAEKNDFNPQTTGEIAEAECPKVVPFEFRALEACLESACKCLESETKTLEEEAYPALDELTTKISTLNLERVRKIKSRLAGISGRVQKVRDELEHLLDDDKDMAEMCLTEKLISNSLDEASLEEEVNPAPELENYRAEDSRSEKNSEIYNDFKPKIKELEMLLEAYFAQIDGVLQKLSDMSEYVSDMEDCINIMLDETQNELLQMGVILSSATVILNVGICIVGTLGINIHIDLFEAPTIRFWETVICLVAGCVALYLIAIGWGVKKNLIDV